MNFWSILKLMIWKQKFLCVFYYKIIWNFSWLKNVVKILISNKKWHNIFHLHFSFFDGNNLLKTLNYIFMIFGWEIKLIIRRQKKKINWKNKNIIFNCWHLVDSKLSCMHWFPNDECVFFVAWTNYNFIFLTNFHEPDFRNI